MNIRYKISIFVFLLLIIFWIGYFSFKFYTTGKKISVQNEQQTIIQDVGSAISSVISPDKKLRGQDQGRINILLLGAAGKNKPGPNLTDTVMIMSLDVASKKMALLSLPRDLYVPIPETNYSTRLNSVYQYGLNNDEGADPVKKVVENITGLSINYYMIVNFDAFTKIVDDIGGININVERDIYDTRYPGPNYSYETFELKQGFQQLDGATALKYVRERHDDPQGDFGRAKRQQQVIQAVKNKVFSAQTLLNPLALNNLLNTLGDSIQTDVPIDELQSFIGLSKVIDTQNINNVVADAWQKDSPLKVSHIMVGSIRAFILVPRVGNWSEIQDIAQNIFDYNKIKDRQAQMENEAAKIAIVNESGDSMLAQKIKTLLRERLKLNVTQILTPAQGKRTNSSVIDVTQGQKLFTLDELLKKLPAQLDRDGNDYAIMKAKTDSDLIVVLGADLIKTYSFEEDSIDDLKNAPDSQEFNLIRN